MKINELGSYSLYLLIKRNEFVVELAHPNIRLFITHGGLLGMQEAIFNTVPLLGLPVINDQFINMVKIVKEGAGLSLEWSDINEDILKTTLLSILQDSR